MEVKVTQFVKDNRPEMYSASQAELGRFAGEITWRNATRDGMKYLNITDPEQLEEIRDYFAGFGAWEEEEIRIWSVRTLNALLLQEIAAHMRDRVETTTPYEGDDGEYYFYVGT